MKYCPNCGAACDDGEKFCHQCGTRLVRQDFGPGAGGSSAPNGGSWQAGSGGTGQIESGYGGAPNGGSWQTEPGYGGAPNGGSWRPAIRPRNIALCILFSILTCGIYRYYWIAKMNDDTKELVRRPEETSGGMVVLFSILTCGIYELYWLYKMGERVDEMKNRPNGNSALLFLILPLAGAFASGVLYWATNENYSGTGFACMIFVVLGIIQDTINKAAAR
jgi:hypothetical protein